MLSKVRAGRPDAVVCDFCVGSPKMFHVEHVRRQIRGGVETRAECLRRLARADGWTSEDVYGDVMDMCPRCSHLDTCPKCGGTATRADAECRRATGG